MERPAEPNSSSERPGAADSVTRGFLFSDLRAYTAYVASVQSLAGKPLVLVNDGTRAPEPGLG